MFFDSLTILGFAALAVAGKQSILFAEMSLTRYSTGTRKEGYRQDPGTRRHLDTPPLPLLSRFQVPQRLEQLRQQHRYHNDNPTDDS
jgi:hypothetical protein